MYRVITFKSKELKKKTIYIETEPDISVSDFDDVETERRRSRKKKDEGKVYMIDGVEVREEDLTNDEKMDLQAEALLNADGFYTALMPFDQISEEKEENFEDEESNSDKKKDFTFIKIAGVMLGAIALIAGMFAFMLLR